MVTTEEAARRAGVSARTIRRWLQCGLLPATPRPDGNPIAVGDLAGATAGAGQRSRARGQAVTDAATGSRLAVNANTRDQLMSVRDEWLAPLVAQITPRRMSLDTCGHYPRDAVLS